MTTVQEHESNDYLPINQLEHAIREGISHSVGSGRPEAVLREYVQPVLATILGGRGARSRVRNEFTLAVPSMANASLLDAPLDTRGRADAIYNRFVIEFEPPGSLRPSAQHSATTRARAQVQQYLRGLAEETGLPMERLAGCAFDGSWIVYVMWERGSWRDDMRPLRVDRSSLSALVETLESMASGRGLTADNLYEDYGPEHDIARQVVQSFYRIFNPGQPSGRTLAMFGQWQIDLGNASGPFSSSDLQEWSELCNRLGLPDNVAASPRVLFCLQTYFALVSKLVALVILEGATKAILVQELLDCDVRDGFKKLESGELTMVTGTSNVIEPGVFSWYLGEHRQDMDQALEMMVRTAAEYSAEIVEITPLVARDVLKDLYQRLLPRSIRHRLGEFYTPDWLAQRVVDQATGSPERLDPSKRVLDPACGSGTFLVEVISRMIRTAIGRDNRRTLIQILENVVGFDLSPLAVQASKVNYLLALSPLLRYANPREPVSIPVFLADSVSPPRRGGLLEGDAFVLHTSEGPWRLPNTLAEANYLPMLGALIQQGLAEAEERDERWFRKELPFRIPLVEGRDDRVIDEAVQLYLKVRDLHRADRDGMWWQMITNAFAPMLQPRFDYVVGNPPWVSWETLPESYRRTNDDLWLAYGLRPDALPDRRQASTNVPVDISMLFVARSLDTYLEEDGRLGFVITASIFQSELAGRGFRRRRLGSGQYRFVHIDDMSSLNVFEEAINITSVLVADRRDGSEARVPVLRWTGRTSRTIPAALGLPTVMDLTVRREYYAEPADPLDRASPLLMMALEGLEASRPVRRRSPYLDGVRNGIHTRGANGIFFVEAHAEDGDRMLIRNQREGGRNREVPLLDGPVERGAIRRLLRGEDVARGTATPSGWLLFFHDDNHTSTAMTPTEASAKFPEAFKYISHFERFLRGRKRFRAFDPTGDNWLGIYSVTTAALASHKVVVREIASGMIAAPVHEANTIPDHKLYVIPCETAREADQLSEVLNSRVVDYILQAFSLSTSITGSFLRYIGVRDLSAAPPELGGESLIAYALGLHADQFRTLDQIAATELE